MSCARLWNRDDGRLMARFHGEFAMKAEELQLEENGLLHRPTKYRVQSAAGVLPNRYASCIRDVRENDRSGKGKR